MINCLQPCWSPDCCLYTELNGQKAGESLSTAARLLAIGNRVLAPCIFVYRLIHSFLQLLSLWLSEEIDFDEWRLEPGRALEQDNSYDNPPAHKNCKNLYSHAVHYVEIT